MHEMCQTICTTVMIYASLPRPAADVLVQLLGHCCGLALPIVWVHAHVCTRMQLHSWLDKMDTAMEEDQVRSYK